jgi:uncharacterized protein (TIGR00299 family) protein
VLEESAAALDIGASLRVARVDRSGISATKVHVLEDGELAEAVPGHGPEHQHTAEHTHEHGHTYTHEHPHEHTHHADHEHAHGGAHDDAEAHGHTHAPDQHGHAHGRSLSGIRRLIERAALAEEVKRTALWAFELLGAAEARIHNVPVENIHFHEVGAVDAIVDIVAASAGIHHLQVDAWYASPLNVGGGMVECAHGTFPVPAPATADLLRGVPVYSAHVQKELVTPTGAALIRALAPTFGPQPAMRVERIGYGAGTRNPPRFPNVLRLSLGEAADAAHGNDRTQEDVVTVLETALDDSSPQLLAYVAEKAMAMGALDAMLAPVMMKKGRPGTLLTILCRPADREAIAQLVLRETTTLGLRVRDERRLILRREITRIATPYGSIRVKRASDPATGEARNVAPEYEDCRAAAEQHGVPLKLVHQAALRAASDG